MQIKRMIDIVRRENTSVRGYGSRATVLSKIASGKEEGSDGPGVLLPGQRVDRKAASDVRVEVKADREGFPKVTNGSSQWIIIESLSWWKGEQEDDSNEKEEGSIPTGDTVDSASATCKKKSKEVGKKPPPPPEGHCVQIAADANPLG